MNKMVPKPAIILNVRCFFEKAGSKAPVIGFSLVKFALILNCDLGRSLLIQSFIKLSRLELIKARNDITSSSSKSKQFQ